MLPDNPFKGILDREETASYVNQHFQDTIGLLREIVDYGTHLIPRCYTTAKSKDLTAAVVLGTLLKHSVAMLDAIDILVSQGAVFLAHLPARGLFETYLFIHWILKEDTEKRVEQYYVWHLRRELKWAKRGIVGSEQQEVFFNAVDDFAKVFSEEVDLKQDEIQESISSLENLLNGDSYREINDEFEKMKSKKTGLDVDWFRPWGPKSRYQMAKDLGLGAQYTIFYDQYSAIMHGTVTGKHIKFKDEHITFIPIRHLEGIKTLLQPVITYSFYIYQTILGHFRPSERENFARKYATEWRKRFHSIKSVKYRVKTEFLD